MKRAGYISWDEYFMGVAVLASKRSKDPNTQVGACIVGSNNIILSTGYNGFPIGCSDDEYPWDREGNETKYPYVVHAELNAILNANGKSLHGAMIYVALFPCNECHLSFGQIRRQRCDQSIKAHAHIGRCKIHAP